MFSKASEIIKSLIERSLYLLTIKKIYLSLDIIMELRELSKLSEDYIAELLTKLGLVLHL